MCAADPGAAFSACELRAWRLHVVAVAIVAIGVFAGSLGFEFTLDSIPIVGENPLVQQPGGFGALWRSNYWGENFNAGLYRPLTVTTYWLNARLGAATIGFHLVNLILHAGVSLLVLSLGLRLTGRPRAAFLTAILFAIHPVHSEAVADVVGRAEILAALGVLAALHLWLSGETTKRPWSWGLGVGLAWLGALFAKESAVILPAVLGGALLACPQRLSRVRGRFRSAAFVLPAAGALLLYFAVRMSVLGSPLKPLGAFTNALDNPLVTQPFGVRLAMQPAFFLHALRLLLFPINLSPDYGISVFGIHAAPPASVWMAAAVVMIGLVAVAWRAGSRPLIVGAATFVVSLLPVSSLFFTTGTHFGERLLYLPMAIFGLGLAWTLDALMLQAAGRRRLMNAAGGALAGLIVLCLALLSVAHVPAWSNNTTLWRSATRAQPRSRKAQLNVGALALLSQENDVALHALRQARRISGTYKTQLYLGTALRRAGLSKQARRAFRAAARVNPAPPDTFREMAMVEYQLGSRDRAHAALRMSALRGAPAQTERDLLGRLYEHYGRLDRSLFEYQRERQEPHSLSALVNVSSVLIRRGAAQSAERFLLRGMERHRNSANLLLNLGSAQWILGKKSKAHLSWRSVLAGAPPASQPHQIARSMLKRNAVTRHQAQPTEGNNATEQR